MEAIQTTLHNDANSIAAEFKDYAYSVSHDLSAPVRAMVELSKLLTSEHAASLNDEGREYLAIIIENGQKMQAMMEGLLQYSRLNTMAKPFSPVSIARLIDDCHVVMSPLIKQTGTTFEIGELPTLKVDVEQMTQLFLALIDNAIKYQPKGNKPHIKISAEEKNGLWHFAVEDNGIGINPKFQEKIFKLFQRLHTDEEFAGVGVGLTRAQKIAHRHGGKIWCEPLPERGSVFIFTLMQ